MEWANKEGRDWKYHGESDEDVDVCLIAGEYGHLEIPEWVHKNGWDWDSQQLCWSASYNGHSKVVQWAIQHGCTWWADMALEAARN
jgi:hypothetical protein